jgi:tetratricopeptide (TPR) repeat protein
MGTVAVLTGRFGLAQRYFRISEDYSKMTNPFRPVPELDVALAAYYNSISDLKKMQEHALQAMEIAQNAGILRQWGIAKVSLVYCLWGQANYDEALAACGELLQAAEDSSDQQLSAWGLLAKGCVLMRRGLTQDAVGSFERGIKIAKELPDYITLTGLAGWMGRTYLILGNVEGAIDLLEDTERTIDDEIGNIPGSAYLDNGLVAAYLTKAESSDSQERLNWLEKTRPILRRTLKEARRNRFTLPDAQLFQGRYEWLNNQPKKALVWWEHSLSQAKATGLRYQEGIAHLEIGHRMGQRDHLLEAESILEEIGAEFDLTMAREVLGNLA